MINEDIKDQLSSNILQDIQISKNEGGIKKQQRMFNNSQLIVAFHRKRKFHHHTLSADRKVKPTNKAITLAVNSNLNYQIFNVVSTNQLDNKAEFLKKKALKIIKCPEKMKNYKSLSSVKKRQVCEPEIRLSRTQVLKSILIQYDRNVENKIYLKKQVAEIQEPSFLTELGDTSKAKINNSMLTLPYTKSSLQNKKDIQSSRYKTNLRQNQIQQIVRKSLSQIESKKKKDKLEESKSTISVTKKVIYLKKMKRSQMSSDYL